MSKSKKKRTTNFAAIIFLFIFYYSLRFTITDTTTEEALTKTGLHVFNTIVIIAVLLIGVIAFWNFAQDKQPVLGDYHFNLKFILLVLFFLIVFFEIVFIR
jgi:hypothetical protein